MKVKFDNRWWNVRLISHPKLGEGFEISFTKMYGPPHLSYAVMAEIAEMFGTKEIDFNNSIALDGCDTCGYGSRYGYEIEVYKATKNPCIGGKAYNE